MSAVKTYHLQAQVDTGLATQSQVRNSSVSSPRAATPVLHEVPPHILGVCPGTSSAMALYNDVVATRPPSPLKETSSVMVTPSAVRPENENISNQSV